MTVKDQLLKVIVFFNTMRLLEKVSTFRQKAPHCFFEVVDMKLFGFFVIETFSKELFMFFLENWVFKKFPDQKHLVLGLKSTPSGIFRYCLLIEKLHYSSSLKISNTAFGP